MRATDPEYALAMKNADTANVQQLENLFELQAEEIAIQTCLVMQPFLISYQKNNKTRLVQFQPNEFCCLLPEIFFEFYFSIFFW